MIQSRLWAITSYFDPFNCGHRLPAYREFRRRLPVPLVAVELRFGGCFQLEPNDADILIRVSGGSVLWQKERLLNIALRALPAHVGAVAWLDCDVVLLREDWPEAVLERLQDFEMVQPFRHGHYQERGECVEKYLQARDGAYESAAFRFAQGSLPEEAYRMPGMSLKLRYMPGMAWVARRELLDGHGFYDTGVIGGGDKLMFSAAAGRYERIARWMSPAHLSHYCTWARPFAESVKGRISYLEGHLIHLWHGHTGTNRYYERSVGFEEFQFDPGRDLAMTRHGVWRWNSDKLEMQAFVRDQLSLLVPSAAG
jgi:hypothetical protein